MAGIMEGKDIRAKRRFLVLSEEEELISCLVDSSY